MSPATQGVIDPEQPWAVVVDAYDVENTVPTRIGTQVEIATGVRPLSTVFAELIDAAKIKGAFIPLRVLSQDGQDTFIITPHGIVLPASTEVAESEFADVPVVDGRSELGTGGIVVAPESDIEAETLQTLPVATKNEALDEDVAETSDEDANTFQVEHIDLGPPDLAGTINDEPEVVDSVPAPVRMEIPDDEETIPGSEIAALVHLEPGDLAQGLFTGGVEVAERGGSQSLIPAALTPLKHPSRIGRKVATVGVVVVLIGGAWAGATWVAQQTALQAETVDVEMVEAEARARSARSAAYATLAANEGHGDLVQDRAGLRSVMEQLDDAAPTSGALNLATKNVEAATAALVEADVALAIGVLEDAEHGGNAALKDGAKVKLDKDGEAARDALTGLLETPQGTSGEIRLLAAHIDAATAELKLHISEASKKAEEKTKDGKKKKEKANTKPSPQPVPAPPKAPAPPNPKPAPPKAPAPAPKPKPQQTQAPAGKVTGVSVGSVASASSAPGQVTFSITVQTSGSVQVSGAASVGGKSAGFSGSVNGSKTFVVTVSGVSPGSQSWRVQTGGLGPSGTITVY